MTARRADIGWKNKSEDHPEIAALRSYLEQHNGISGLETYQPHDTEHIVEAFDRDGFVLVADVLDQEQIEILRAACLDTIDEILELDQSAEGNRGSHRYSFGGSSLTHSQLHQPAWRMLLNLDVVLDLVAAIFRSEDFMLRSASGDFCLPGAHEYQILHADTRDWISDEKTPYHSFHDPRGVLKIRDLPCPYVCVNFLPQEITRINGPTRQIPGTQNSRARIPRLEQEPEWMRLSTVCPAPAGAIMIRDVRAWHGGTPNLSNEVRSIPNLEFYAPWFREPVVPGISYEDFRTMSDRAQKIARFTVLDSSETLRTGAVLRPLK